MARRTEIKPDLLDIRQREAACLLLAAVDLPAPVPAVSRLWIEASKVFPGATVDVLTGGRTVQLIRARGLIDAMLGEAQPKNQDQTMELVYARIALARAGLGNYPGTSAQAIDALALNLEGERRSRIEAEGALAQLMGR